LFKKYFANEYIDNAEEKNSLRDFVATFFMPEKFYFILFHKLFCFWWQWE